MLFDLIMLCLIGVLLQIEALWNSTYCDNKSSVLFFQRKIWRPNVSCVDSNCSIQVLVLLKRKIIFITFRCRHRHQTVLSSSSLSSSTWNHLHINYRQSIYTRKILLGESATFYIRWQMLVWRWSAMHFVRYRRTRRSRWCPASGIQGSAVVSWSPSLG